MTISLPGALSVPYTPLSGGYSPGFPPRHVNHTTETAGLPQYSGSNPHATVDVKRRKVYQHQSLDQPCKALRGSEFAGIETNRAHCYQTEFIGYSHRPTAQSIGRDDLWVGSWTAADWAFIGGYMRTLSGLTGVPMRGFGHYENRAHPMSRTQWQEFSGFCGHQHVPGSDHWDPSAEWREDLVLEPAAPGAYPGSPVQAGDEGDAVRKVQHWLNLLAPGNVIPEDGRFGTATSRRVRNFQHNHHLDADGVVGPVTWRALREAAREAQA